MTRVCYDTTNYYFQIDDCDELRRSGVCKEHRQPILTDGTLAGQKRHPYRIQALPRKCNNRSAMIAVSNEIKQDYEVSRVIIVTDKRLNTSDDIATCIAMDDIFVHSQLILGAQLSRELREWVYSGKSHTEQDKDNFKTKTH